MRIINFAALIYITFASFIHSKWQVIFLPIDYRDPVEILIDGMPLIHLVAAEY